MPSFNVENKSVLIAGGSKGLGRELALQLTAEGAHVTILARSQGPLDDALREMSSHKRNVDQHLSASSLDLTNAKRVEDYVTSLTRTPEILFCVAGGTADEIGFFADVSSSHIRSCMENNYFSAAFIAQALLKRWVATAESPRTPIAEFHMVFTASTAALVSLPGYIAYAPTKTATRALADTLRQEVLLYQSRCDIKIHCSLPGTILTDAFYQEQRSKPALCKELEGSDKEPPGLSAGAVAALILQGLKKGKFMIATDFSTELLLNNMRGPSPRDSPVRDWLLGLLGSLVWPVFRFRWDRKTERYGQLLCREVLSQD
ncbi:hypothetical protein MMC11_008505 [Xylographa trunciseda]|nr:hypothetical protein [Xylographa trunciseda]